MNTIHILTLLTVPGIGRKTVQYALDTCKNAPSGVRDLRRILLHVKDKHPRIHVPNEKELEKAQKDAQVILERAESLGVEVIGSHGPRFPERLRTIPDPPVVLYAKGAVECLAMDLSVAVIGTREPTSYGEKAAARLGAIFAEEGIVVVSGLAAGCDSAAHHGCLEAGGRTVAVLAHGPDIIYPVDSHELSERILASDGCLVSEYPPGQKPRKGFFIERDRLQSGLSSAVVVVETDIKGGTMHTVRFCIEQGRLLACLVHPPELASHQKSRGNQQLIAEGKATPLKNRAAIEDFVAKISKSSVGPPSAYSETGFESSESDGRGQLPLFDYDTE